MRPGLCSIIKRADAVLIPAVMDGAYDAWPRHKRILGFHKIRVIFGAPIEYDGAVTADDEQFAEMIEKTLRELQRELRGR